MLVSRRCFAFVLTALLLVACGESSTGSAERWVLGPEDPLPAQLSEVGIFEDVALRKAYADVVRYVPNHRLYSNGLEKERHLYIPEGTKVEVDRTDPWGFPVGTVLAKTFSYDGEPVETRLIFRTDGGWDYAVYQWRSNGADAERLPGNWAEGFVDLGDGDLTHTVPSRLDCRTCHETHEAVAGVPVLGVSKVQTGSDLIEAGVFSEPPPLDAVNGRSEEETAALSYFIGNCTSCHNGGDSINSSFSLYPDDAVANTVGQPTESQTGEGVRVVSGDPEHSVLYISVVEAASPGYKGPFKPMPPIGLNVIDPDAQTILSSWIEGL